MFSLVTEAGWTRQLIWIPGNEIGDNLVTLPSASERAFFLLCCYFRKFRL